MVEENINIKFRANAAQLTKIIKQLKTLQTKINSLSKNMTKFNTTLKRVGDRFGTTTKKSSALNKQFRKQDKEIKAIRKSLERLTGSHRKYAGASKKATTQTGRMGSSIGLTGFQFGFLGGMALLAGDRLKTFFVDIVRDGIEDLENMNRAIVQSGINLQAFLGGNFDEFDAVSDRIKDIQDDFGEFTTGEVASAFEQIGRAVGENVSIEDIEAITRQLLTISRIDKTAGPGLAKVAVDMKRVMTQFGITADGLDQFVDKLVNTNQQGAIELGQLVSSLGFAGAQAQRFGVGLNETLALTGFVFEKSGRKAGAAGRTFGNILDKLASTQVATNQTLKDMGIHILDASGNFNEFNVIVDQSRRAFAKLKSEGKGQIFESALLEEFGFDKTAARGYLSLVQAEKSEIDALIREVEKEGTATILSAAIGEGAGVKLKTFENEIRNLKLEFAVGLVPALQSFTEAVKEFTGDKEFVRVLQEFSAGMGETIKSILDVAVPILKFFGDILKSNTPLVKALAAATVVLTGALTGLGVIFLVLGAMFSMIRIHENLIIRGTANATSTNFLARAYARLVGAMSLANIKMRLVEAGFTRMAIKARLAGLSIRIFSISSIVHLLAVGAAWLVALAPLVIAVAAFVAFILVLRHFQDEIVAVADELDKTGTAGNNFAANMDGLFDFLSTGDVSPFFDAIDADIRDTETRLNFMTASWNQFLDDLEKSAAFQFISEQLTNLQNFFIQLDLDIKAFIESISFDLPDIWEALKFILFNITGAFGFLVQHASDFLESIGFDMPKVWKDFDGWLVLVRARFKFLIDPIDDFLELINFDMPDVFGILNTAIGDLIKEWEKLVAFIKSNPIVAGILEIAGIVGKLDENLDEAIFTPAEGEDRGKLDLGKPDSFFDDVIIPQPSTEGNGLFEVDEATLASVELFKKSVENQSGNLDKYNEQLAEIIKTSEGISESNTTNIESVNESSATTDTNSGIVALLSATENILINEFIKNINLSSKLSTIITETMLMFANLIAQGNRAAGKLASLRVSDSGKFSITDPGVSSFDQKRINAAEALVGSTRGNEVNLQQTIIIDVNQNNNGVVNNKQNAQDLADDIAAALAAQVGQIT